MVPSSVSTPHCTCLPGRNGGLGIQSCPICLSAEGVQAPKGDTWPSLAAPQCKCGWSLFWKMILPGRHSDKLMPPCVLSQRYLFPVNKTSCFRHLLILTKALSWSWVFMVFFLSTLFKWSLFQGLLIPRPVFSKSEKSDYSCVVQKAKLYWYLEAHKYKLIFPHLLEVIFFDWKSSSPLASPIP